jgi:hypothetical protein
VIPSGSTRQAILPDRQALASCRRLVAFFGRSDACAPLWIKPPTIRRMSLVELSRRLRAISSDFRWA